MVINELSLLRFRRSPQVPERRPCPSARPAIAGLLVATFRQRRTLPSEGKGRRYGLLARMYTYYVYGHKPDPRRSPWFDALGIPSLPPMRYHGPSCDVGLLEC